LANNQANREDVQKTHELKKALHRGLFSQPQAAEVVNFYQQSRDLSAIEKDRTENLLQGIDRKTERQYYHATLYQVSFYSRYPSYLRQNAFLMLFSLVEELLASAYEVLKGINIKSDGSDISRFVQPYRELSIELTSIKRWEFLSKCQTVRNALLHANGNIALCRESLRNKLQDILANWSPFFGKRQGLIKIKKGGQVKSEYLDVKEAGINELLHAFNDLDDLILGPNKV